MNELQFKVLLMNYTNFVTHKSQKHGLPGQTDKFRFYEKGLECRGSFEELAKKKDFFVEVQKHLQNRVGTLVKSLQKTDEVIIFSSLPGNYKIVLDPKSNSVKGNFVAAERLQETKRLDLDIEKDLADIAFSELLLDHDIFPDRFKRCPGCGTYFYQPTAREKTYCSNSCGHALRQRERYNPARASK